MRRALLISIVATACCALSAPLSALGAQSRGAGPHVTVELVPVSAGLRPGDQVVLEIRLTIDDGWYIYGPEPADLGLPTTVRWRAPAGFRAGGTIWPARRRRMENGATARVYEGEVVVRGTLIPPPGLSLPVRVGATVGWAACREVCIPYEATLFIDLSRPPQGPA